MEITSAEFILIEKYCTKISRYLNLVNGLLEKEIIKSIDLNPTTTRELQGESSYELIDIRLREIEHQLSVSLRKLGYLSEKK